MRSLYSTWIEIYPFIMTWNVEHQSRLSAAPQLPAKEPDPSTAHVPSRSGDCEYHLARFRHLCIPECQFQQDPLIIISEHII